MIDFIACPYCGAKIPEGVSYCRRCLGGHIATPLPSSGRMPLWYRAGMTVAGIVGLVVAAPMVLYAVVSVMFGIGRHEGEAISVGLVVGAFGLMIGYLSIDGIRSANARI